MRVIKVRLDPPVLPEDGSLTLNATSYQISKDFEFKIQDNIVYEDLKNSTDLFYKKVRIDVSDNTTLYIRVKYHFQYFDTGSNQMIDKETIWSRPIPVSENDNRLKLSSSIVNTPTLEVEKNNENELIEITSSDFGMYSGFGTHKATTWRIEDLNNTLYFSRENDVDNLKSIIADDNLDSGKIYKVMCKYVASDNTESNYGARLLANYTPFIEQFSFDAPEDFVNGRKFYFRIKLWTRGFQHYDFKIVSKATGEEVVSLVNQTSTTNVIKYTKVNYTIVEDYEFYVRLMFKDRSVSYQTEWTKVLETSLGLNTIYLNRPKTTYADKFDSLATVPGLLTNGITCIATRETFDNKVICSDFSSKNLWLYTTEENTLKRIKILYSFEEDLDLDYLNIIQLPNHDILVDAVVYKDNKQKYSAFYVFEYNTVKQELTLLGSYVREDERYCTSMSNSLVVTKDGNAWYVPAYQTNGKNDDRQELKLRRFNTSSFIVDKEVSLPFKARYNVGVFIDYENNVYIHSGSMINKYETESGDRTEVWERTNNLIYKFDITKETFTEYIELPDDIPDSIYCLHAFLRQDNKVVFFNSCHSGKALEYNKFIVLNLEDKTFNITDYNGTINVPMRTTLRLKSGDIIRVTAMLKDPQKVLVYRSNSRQHIDIPNFDTVEKESGDLIVTDGEIVNIEDIYKFKNIDIQGSGIVKWFRPQGVTILTSKTYVCNKDNQFNSTTFNGRKYDSVLILDGNQLKITEVNTTN